MDKNRILSYLISDLIGFFIASMLPKRTLGIKKVRAYKT